MAKREFQSRQFQVRALARMTGLTEYDVEVLHTKLRRINSTLRRWYELECGDAYGRCIERDEATQAPYLTYERGNGQRGRYQVADRERGALKRLAFLCMANNLAYYVQTDPRGNAVYVAGEPLTDTNYSSKGVAIW